MRSLFALLSLGLLAACAAEGTDRSGSSGAEAQQMSLLQNPPMNWGSKSGAEAWTRATLAALDREGVTVISQVPTDIEAFCPNYAQLNEPGRRAFWAGLLSAVAKHESTHNPAARGGGGRWLGLMQIAPATWRNYDCQGDITNGADNMSCAVRIMSRQVGRDNAVVHDGDGWRGVARDWAPLRSPAKRADIAAWTSSQSYCVAKS